MHDRIGNSGRCNAVFHAGYDDAVTDPSGWTGNPLTDTVGFINKLPHHLIDAFRSTLEEARYADYILHVVDTSNPQMELQMQVVYDTLRELKVEDKKIVIPAEQAG